MAYRLLLLSFFFLAQVKSFAQNANDSLIISAEERKQIDDAVDHSTFRNFFLVDSFSRVGDSVNAGAALLNVSPYVIFHENVLADSIAGYIDRHFRITERIKQQYADLYRKMYVSKKSQTYSSFLRMYEEDQAGRIAYEKRGDSATRAMVLQRVMNDDSVHFDYLYRYVKKNGWPSLADGSLYAEVIAIHDHQHYNFYFLYLKKAVIKGEADYSTILLMMLWRLSEYEYNEFQSCLETKSYVSFDVTSMFDHILPANMPEIEEAVEKYCPSILHLVIEAITVNMYNSLGTKIMDPWITIHSIAAAEQKNIESRLELDLVKHMKCITYDPRIVGRREAYRTGLPMLPTWKKSDDLKPRLILYITYCNKDDDGFYSIITNKKLTTHTIHFDVDSITIKPESKYLLRRLADWLQKRPTIKLEIAGHTDNVGNAAANLKLSQDRANEVMRELVAHGVDASRLTAVGYGTTRPIQNNGTLEGKAENRRVEFIKK